MKIAAHQNTKKMVLALAVVMVLSSFLCNAAGADDVFIKGYTGPFNPFFRKGTWTTRVLGISNTGLEDRLCDIGCITTDPEMGSMQFSRQALIPPNSLRKVKIAYRPGNLLQLRKPKNNTSPLSYEQNYKLWDAKTARQLDTQSSSVPEIPPRFKVFGIVNSANIQHDTNTYIKDTSVLGRTKLISCRESELPDRWYGYSILDILAVGSIDLDKVRNSQIDALLQWVRRGGTLILTGHEGMGQILQGRIGQAAGTKSLGVHWTDELQTTDIATGRKAAVTLDWPMPFVELYSTGAEILIEANHMPLLTLRRVGQGNILTLAIPLGAARPVKNFNLWAAVRRAANSVPAIWADKFPTPARATLKEIAGRPGPTRIVPASILFAMTVFVVAMGFGLRFRRRGEIVWMLLIPASLALAVGLYVYGRTLTNPQRLSNIGLISGLGDDHIRVQQAFAYCSGPRSQEPTFSANSLNGLISDTGRSATAAMEINRVETTDSSVILPKQKVRPNATRGFYVDTVIRTAGIKPKLTFDSQGVFGTITNNLGLRINDAVFLVNFKTYRVGSLKADGETPIRITPADLLGDVKFHRVRPQPTQRRRPTKKSRAKGKTPRPKARAKSRKHQRPANRIEATGEFTGSLTPDKRRNNLVRQLLSTPSLNRTISRQPLLIGYSPGSLINPLPSWAGLHEGWSVVTWPITISVPKPGTEVLIPSGFVEKQLRNASSPIWNSHSMEFHDSSRPGELIILARPPWKNGRLKNATATITFKIQATGYSLTASGVKLSNKIQGRRIVIASRSPIETFSNPAGTFEVTIPQADRFVDKSGWLVFSLEVKGTSAVRNKTARPSKKGTSPRKNQAATKIPWKFKSVDVVLKGYAS